MPRLLDILSSSGARIIIVPGNNDVEEYLDSPERDFEFCPRNTVIELMGKRVCLCHELSRIDPDISADIYLYGHGVRGERHTPFANEENGRLYFNASWGPSLHIADEDKHTVLPLIEL